MTIGIQYQIMSGKIDASRLNKVAMYGGIIEVKKFSGVFYFEKKEKMV